MKFGKSIRQEMLNNPCLQYLNYKQFKKLIKNINKCAEDEEMDEAEKLNEKFENVLHENLTIIEDTFLLLFYDLSTVKNEIETKITVGIDEDIQKIEKNITFDELLCILKEKNVSKEFFDFCIQLSVLSNKCKILRTYTIFNYIGLIKILKKKRKHCDKYGLKDIYTSDVLSKYSWCLSDELPKLITSINIISDEFMQKFVDCSLTLEKYTCPICLCLINDPVTLNTCFHSFCWNCLATAIHKFSIDSCPICRTKIICDSNSIKIDGILSHFLKKYFANKEDEKETEETEEMRREILEMDNAFLNYDNNIYDKILYNDGTTNESRNTDGSRNTNGSRNSDRSRSINSNRSTEVIDYEENMSLNRFALYTDNSTTKKKTSVYKYSDCCCNVICEWDQNDECIDGYCTEEIESFRRFKEERKGKNFSIGSIFDSFEKSETFNTEEELEGELELEEEEEEEEEKENIKLEEEEEKEVDVIEENGVGVDYEQKEIEADDEGGEEEEEEEDKSLSSDELEEYTSNGEGTDKTDFVENKRKKKYYFMEEDDEHLNDLRESNKYIISSNKCTNIEKYIHILNKRDVTMSEEKEKDSDYSDEYQIHDIQDYEDNKEDSNLDYGKEKNEDNYNLINNVISYTLN